VELIETSTFTRQITALLRHEEYGKFQFRLAENPALGAVISGGAGIRKIRVAVGSRGKSGGARVIYYWAMRKDTILLLFCILQEGVGRSGTETVGGTRQISEEGI
jgi:mRNA-degrading endonuclease RelE of RelBE toxin-antitoxin system